MKKLLQTSLVLAMIIGTGIASPQTTMAFSPVISSVTLAEEQVLKIGMDNSDRVIELQQALVEVDISVGQVDGDFGVGTQSAVMTFQKKHGLVADGIAGPNTLRKLNALRGLDKANSVKPMPVASVSQDDGVVLAFQALLGRELSAEELMVIMSIINSNKPTIIVDTEGGDDKSCEIDLAKNTHTCDKVGNLSFVKSPYNGQAVVKLNLDSKYEYDAVKIDVEFGDKTSGYLLNIGDSATNNGHAGDAGTQSNDAELQLENENFQIYASDYIKTDDIYGTNDDPNVSDHRVLLKQDLDHANTEASFMISDGKVTYSLMDGKYEGEFEREHSDLDRTVLFALDGQDDAEGSVNYDIYASFNKVISEYSRLGSGAEKVKIEFVKTF